MFILLSDDGSEYCINSYGFSVLYTIFLYIQMILIMSDKSMMKNREDKIKNIKPTIEMIAFLIMLDYIGKKGYFNIV